MGQLIYNEPDRLREWALARMPDVPAHEDSHTLGLEEDGQLVVVVIYESFSRHMCNMHVVSDNGKRWCTRSFLAAAFAYPFLQLDLVRVSAMVPARNAKALKMDIGLGFKPEGVMRGALGDDDLIVLGMLRSECIWIAKEAGHGRR